MVVEKLRLVDCIFVLDYPRHTNLLPGIHILMILVALLSLAIILYHSVLIVSIILFPLCPLNNVPRVGMSPLAALTTSNLKVT